MNILSLFDGISCGRVALERANIKVDNYYASEIDKYAESISKYNYPNITRLGDINNWKEWDIDFSSIYLLLAGFPCQSWSLAGKQQGDKDIRGQLMWVMLDILHHIQKLNPNIKFLFENVKMKKEFQEYINKAIGVNGILINSLLLSAQSRNRMYWTNINGVNQPKDKKIYLKDILEDNVDDKYYLSEKIIKGFNSKQNNFKGRFNPIAYDYCDDKKSYCLTARYYKMGVTDPYVSYNNIDGLDFIGGIETENHLKIKNSGGIGGKTGLYTIAQRGRYNKEGKIEQQLEINDSGKSNCLTSVQKDSMVYDNIKIRKLTPIECERLQTLDDNFTQFGINGKNEKVQISNTQRYKCLGNGWTVDIIAHILQNLNNGQLR